MIILVFVWNLPYASRAYAVLSTDPEHTSSTLDNRMEHFHCIDKRNRLVIGVPQGFMSKQIILDYLYKIKMDKDFDPLFDYLEDTKFVTDVRISPNELQEIARVFIFDARSRVARIAESNLVYAISREYEAYHELENGENFFVSRSRLDAIKYINEGRKARNIPALDLNFDPLEYFRQPELNYTMTTEIK